MSDSNSITKSMTIKARAARPSGADGNQPDNRSRGVTWSDLTVDAILAHLRSILRGLRDKGVPVTLVRTETGVVITITLAQLARPAAPAPVAQPEPATTPAG